MFARLFNTQNLSHGFHSCFGLKSREHWQEDLEADFDSRGRTIMGKNECSHLANVMGTALTPFFNSSVRPPEHNRHLQGEPNGFSGVSWSFHPLPQLNLQNSSSKFDVNPKPAPKRPQEAECPFMRRHLSGVIDRACLPTPRWVQKSDSGRYKNFVPSPFLPHSCAETDVITLQECPKCRVRNPISRRWMNDSAFEGHSAPALAQRLA